MLSRTFMADRMGCLHAGVFVHQAGLAPVDRVAEHALQADLATLALADEQLVQTDQLQQRHQRFVLGLVHRCKNLEIGLCL